MAQNWTPWMFVSTILFTAFPPPPPMPNTLMTHGVVIPSGVTNSSGWREGGLKGVEGLEEEVSSSEEECNFVVDLGRDRNDVDTNPLLGVKVVVKSSTQSARSNILWFCRMARKLTFHYFS